MPLRRQWKRLFGRAGLLDQRDQVAAGCRAVFDVQRQLVDSRCGQGAVDRVVGVQHQVKPPSNEVWVQASIDQHGLIFDRVDDILEDHPIRGQSDFVHVSASRREQMNRVVVVAPGQRVEILLRAAGAKGLANPFGDGAQAPFGRTPLIPSSPFT